MARLTAIGLAIGALVAAPAASGAAGPDMAAVPAAAAAPSDKEQKKPMSPEERMQARFPQPVRVGDLIGLPVLDASFCTLGYVRNVVRTPDGKIELIVSYGGFLGWGARPVAVPIEAVGIQGRELASLDMARGAYAAAPTWKNAGDEVLAAAATIRIALSRQ